MDGNVMTDYSISATLKSTSSISQYSSAENDISSMVINDSITTVTQKTITSPSMVSPKNVKEIISPNKNGSFTITQNSTSKTVAFNINDCLKSNNSHNNNSFNIINKETKLEIADGILQRQSYERLPMSKFRSLLQITPEVQRKQASTAPNHLDLTYNEWFGFAPLASPETLSEISSISSRNSVKNISNNNINNNSNNNNSSNNNNPKLYTKSVLDDIFESQLHTPTVLRRAPKFTENLSTCAEDSHNLDKYRRLSRIIKTAQTNLEKQPFKFSHTNEERARDDNDNYDDDDDDDDEDDSDSFEMAKGFKHSDNIVRVHKPAFNDNERENSKSADQLDDLLPSSTDTFEYSQEQKLTYSDSNILNDNDNNDQFNRYNTKDSCLTGSCDTTYYSANSSIEHVTCSIQTNMTGGLLESHFPIQDQLQPSQRQYQYNQFTYDNGSLVNKENPKYVLTNKDEIHNLQLVQISEKCIKNLPSTSRKRKSCIYPLVTTTFTKMTGTAKPKQIISSSSSSSSSPLTIETKVTEISTVSLASKQSTINFPASGYIYKSLNESSV